MNDDLELLVLDGGNVIRLMEILKRNVSANSFGSVHCSAIVALPVTVVL